MPANIIHQWHLTEKSTKQEQRIYYNIVKQTMQRKGKSGELMNMRAHRFAIRETTPKEIWTWTTNSIFDCISYNSSNKYRKQKAWTCIQYPLNVTSMVE